VGGGQAPARPRRDLLGHVEEPAARLTFGDDAEGYARGTNFEAFYMSVL